MLAKLHSSILNIHAVVGEKEASEWLSTSDKDKASVSVVKPKTPLKKGKESKKVKGRGKGDSDKNLSLQFNLSMPSRNQGQRLGQRSKRAWPEMMLRPPSPTAMLTKTLSENNI